MIRPDKLKVALLGLLLIIVIGATGYHWIEGWEAGEAVYATIVTLSTVGYGDFYPQTAAGRRPTGVSSLKRPPTLSGI